MNKTIFNFIFFTLAINTLLSAQQLDSTRVVDILTDTKIKYVPDTREGVYTITSVFHNDTLTLQGATTNKNAISEINKEVSTIKGLIVDNQIKILPDAALRDTLYAIINVSVADIRTQNRFTSGMATQSLLGTPVKILEKDGWYRIQMPDTYIGWAHEKQIVTMNKKEFNKWILSPKIIFTKHYGFAYATADKEGETIADLVAGNMLVFLGVEGDFFKVKYPDQRIAYVLRKESQEYALWMQSQKPSTESFVEMAKKMTGIPYVWGGTSTKGFDCSGLVSNIMALHGLTILRDASQQANVGEEVDITNGYENLQVGDLMFFGKPNNIRHVGFYLGDMKFIHASGWTRISSLDSADKDYDELNTKEFVKATRIITNNQLHGIKKIKDNTFYQPQK